MRLRVFLGFAFQTLDVGGKLVAVDPPHTAASDLNGGKGPRANKRVGLGGADAQINRNILEGEEPRLDAVLSRLSVAIGLLRHAHDSSTDSLQIQRFDSVCACLTSGSGLLGGGRFGDS